MVQMSAVPTVQPPLSPVLIPVRTNRNPLLPHQSFNDVFISLIWCTLCWFAQGSGNYPVIITLEVLLFNLVPSSSNSPCRTSSLILPEWLVAMWTTTMGPFPSHCKFLSSQEQLSWTLPPGRQHSHLDSRSLLQRTMALPLTTVPNYPYILMCFPHLNGILYHSAKVSQLIHSAAPTLIQRSSKQLDSCWGCHSCPGVPLPASAAVTPSCPWPLCKPEDSITTCQNPIPLPI